MPGIAAAFLYDGGGQAVGKYVNFKKGGAMAKVLMLVVAVNFYLLSLACAETPVIPKNCSPFFEKSGAVQGAPDCEETCASGSVGLGTYNCLRHCERWCNFGLQKYDESKSNAGDSKISDKEAEKALNENIKDLCAFANNYAVQPSITNAIDSVTSVPGSGTLLMNAGTLSRMVKAKTNRERADVGLELYSNVSGLGGIGAWEQAVNDFKRLMDAMNKGSGGLLQLGQELAQERRESGQALNPRPNLPDVCK